MFIHISISNQNMSFIRALGVRLHLEYATQSFADIVNFIKQEIVAPVKIPLDVGLTILFSLSQLLFVVVKDFPQLI